MEILQQTLIQLKDNLLNICFHSMDENMDNIKLAHSIQDCLVRNFNIEKSSIFLFEGNVIIPLHLETNSYGQKYEISIETINNYFFGQKAIPLPDNLKTVKLFEQYTHMIKLLKPNNVTYGVLFIKGSSKWNEFQNSYLLDEFVEVLSNVIFTIKKHIDVRMNESQYRKLFEMTELFHSTMDTEIIIDNVSKTIEQNYPDLHVELILSNDQERHSSTVNVKQLDYLSERPSTIEAFVSGRVTTEYAQDLNSTILNAPINGRQAIYGILQVSAPINYIFSSTEVEFIRMLAHTAGNALENAKLYHQSHRLISDLQLINETSHHLNMNLNIDEMFHYLQKQLLKSFQPEELCFVLREDDGDKLTETSTAFFRTEEGQSYIEYVKEQFEKSHEPLFIADYSRLILKDVTYKSLMAVPMIVGKKITGFSIVLHREPYFFPFESFKLMQSLIHHSSLAISNSLLRNQLQRMVDHDHLTKLYARSYLDKYVENSLILDSCGMFLLLDIDNFKRVNDQYGHHIGDEVLVQIGKLLMDIVGTRGVCARWGGEELSVYIPNILQDEALKISNEIIRSVPDVTNPQVTVSAGLITWDKAKRPDFKSLFLNADTALYYAKNNGKKQVRLYDESMQVDV